MVNLLLAIIYLAFISLGLPDSLLGSAWPTMNAEFGVPLSYAGIISMIIALGTIVSSLQSDRLTRRFGTGAVTAASVAMTAAALFGFSVTRSFPFLCIWAIPYGLGAGSVDASPGDTYAAGFLYAHSLGMPLKVCGEVGSIIAAKVVEVIGTKIDVPRWKDAKREIRELIASVNQ